MVPTAKSRVSRRRGPAPTPAGSRRHPSETLLIRLLDNEISRDEDSGLIAHIKNCSRCGERIRDFERASRRYEELEAELYGLYFSGITGTGVTRS